MFVFMIVDVTTSLNKFFKDYLKLSVRINVSNSSSPKFTNF